MIMNSNQQNFMSRYLPRIKVYAIQIPKETDWEPERASVFIQHLMTQFKWLTFIILAELGQIVWQIMDIFARVPPDLLI